MIYFLHSVGTAFDPATLETFPINADGTADRFEGSAVHLADCCDEWWASLANSMKDTQTVGKVWRAPEHPRGQR